MLSADSQQDPFSDHQGLRVDTSPSDSKVCDSHGRWNAEIAYLLGGCRHSTCWHVAWLVAWHIWFDGFFIIFNSILSISSLLFSHPTVFWRARRPTIISPILIGWCTCCFRSPRGVDLRVCANVDRPKSRSSSYESDTKGPQTNGNILVDHPQKNGYDL